MRRLVRRRLGSAWQRLSVGLPEPIDSMPYALLTDPAAPADIFACLANGDVWTSTDHGERWQQLPIPIDHCRRAAVMI